MIETPSKVSGVKRMLTEVGRPLNDIPPRLVTWLSLKNKEHTPSTREGALPGPCF